MRVGIVTFEYPGFTKNGGIGTAYGRLSRLLRDEGHQVTVYFLLVNEKALESALNLKIVVESRNPGIQFKIISATEKLNKKYSWAPARSVAVYETLKNEELDFLHIHDCMGFGYHCLLAKKRGDSFQETQIILGLHGPTFWINRGQGITKQHPEDAVMAQMEKDCIEMADQVISPSAYLVEYLKNQGWEFPKTPKILKNVNSFLGEPAKDNRRRQFQKLVFFGRLEPRKGLLLFLDALEDLAQKHESWGREKLEIVFMGKDTELPNGVQALDMIKGRLAQFAQLYPTSFFTDLSDEGCRKYFEENKDILLCIPSVMDNSPFTVLEAMEQGIPFFTSTSGGQVELIRQDHLKQATFDPTRQSLAEAILGHMKHDLWLASPDPSVLGANTQWKNLHVSQNMHRVQGPSREDLV